MTLISLEIGVQERMILALFFLKVKKTGGVEIEPKTGNKQ